MFLEEKKEFSFEIKQLLFNKKQCFFYTFVTLVRNLKTCCTWTLLLYINNKNDDVSVNDSDNNSTKKDTHENTSAVRVDWFSAK